MSYYCQTLLLMQAISPSQLLLVNINSYSCDLCVKVTSTKKVHLHHFDRCQGKVTCPPCVALLSLSPSL